MRIFSSTTANAIGVYYMDQGDDWALGTGPKIEAGWHVYEFDLNTEVNWAIRVGPYGSGQALPQSPFQVAE